MRLPAVASLLLVAALGCSGGDSTAKPSPTPKRPVPSSPAPCESGSPTQPKWPAEVPADLPKPSGAVIEKTEYAPSGVFVVRFETPRSLNDNVLFLVRELPKAGWVLGRGDAEPFEADAPFAKGGIQGLYKLLAKAQCQTLWLLALGQPNSFRNGAPFATAPPSGASSSPLPFG